MLGSFKKCFFTELTILSSFASVNSLSCISMNNQESKVRPQIVNVIGMSLYFFFLALKQVNAVVVVTILMIQMRKYVFLML